MKLIKIFVITTSFPRWQGDGIERSIYELCKGLNKAHQIVVLAPHCEFAKRMEEMDGIRVYRFPYFWPLKFQKLCYGSGIIPNLKKNRLLWIQVPLLFLSQVFSGLKLMKKEKVDLIHSHWLIPSGLTACFCKKTFKKPFVATTHGSDVFPFRKSFLKKFLKITLRDCDICTVNSTATAAAVSEIAGISHKLLVIPPGVNPKVFHPIIPIKNSEVKSRNGDTIPKILTLTRLIKWKGTRYLIEAMAIVLKQLPEARLIVCGDGVERNNLEELAQRLGLSKNIKFMGRVPNDQLPDYYRKASVFVLPSIVNDTGETEAFGVVLLEAMACGTPVVGSNVGGIPDIITDGWNGYLTKEKNPQDIADKIIKILSDREMGKRFSENGLQKINERFSWEVVVKQISDVYERLG